MKYLPTFGVRPLTKEHEDSMYENWVQLTSFQLTPLKKGWERICSLRQTSPRTSLLIKSLAETERELKMEKKEQNKLLVK